MTSPTLMTLSSMATRDLLVELTADYSRRSGVVVDAQAAGGVDIAKRVAAGEITDVVVLSSAAIDTLIAGGALLAPRADLVRSAIAVAVRAGAPRPDIGSEEAVRKAVSAAKTLSFSTGPSGVYLEKLFERWGILADVKARIVVAPPGVPVGSLVASGAAELGFQQVSELMNVAGVEVLGPLPPAIQSITIFSAALAASSPHPQQGRELMEYLAAPETAATKKRHGMEPA